MESHHLYSIFYLVFLQLGRSAAADYSPSAEAEETEALLAILLNSDVSEGHDYAKSFDGDAGIHPKSN